MESVGGKIEEIVTCTVSITDARYYSDVIETRREVFGPSFPVFTTA